MPIHTVHATHRHQEINTGIINSPTGYSVYCLLSNTAVPTEEWACGTTAPVSIHTLQSGRRHPPRGSPHFPEKKFQQPTLAVHLTNCSDAQTLFPNFFVVWLCAQHVPYGGERLREVQPGLGAENIAFHNNDTERLSRRHQLEKLNA